VRGVAQPEPPEEPGILRELGRPRSVRLGLGGVTEVCRLDGEQHVAVAGHGIDLHRFFERQYEDLNEVVDEVAERARTLGAPALGTLNEFSDATRLSEQPGVYPDAMTMIGNLLDDHEAIIRTLRTDLETCAQRYHDIGTNDFLTGLMERHEKMAWMLRSFLQR